MTADHDLEDMLSELFDLISKRLDPDMFGAIAGRLGLGGEDTRTAVATSLPALLGGMAHSAQTPEGATKLLKAIDATNGGESLDGLLERFRGHETVQDTHDTNFFSGMLSGGILQAVIGRLGIGGPVVKKLLGLLGPIVIGALGKLGGSGKLSPTALLSMLTGATGGAADAAPGGRSGFASILGPIAGLLGLGGGAAAAVDAVDGSVGNVVDTVAERERASAAAAPAAASAPAAAAEAAPAAAEAVPVAQERRKKGAAWMWGSIALAAVLAAIVAGKGCDANVNTAPVATTPTTTQPAAAGSFSIATSADGKVTLSGAVPSEDAKTAAFTGAEAAWGAGNVINNLTVDANTGAIPGVDVIGKTIAALKGAGSGWTALFNGTDRLTLTGEVASAAVKSGLVSAATAAFAPGTVVDQLTVKSGASEEAKKAVADINKEISLRGVTFVTGSANLTAASRTTLDRVAKLLDEADDVRAQVQGHTDNQGDAAANLALSTARAKAVVAYLVGKGVDANRLVAKGYGQTKPIATNDTEAGRAKNRRVVFAVIG